LFLRKRKFCAEANRPWIWSGLAKDLLPFLTRKSKQSPDISGVIQKALNVFGVDISTVFDLYLPDVFHHIATHMPEEARARLRAIATKAD